MSKKCPKCGSVDIIQNGKYKDGSVGYKCRKCGEMFILLTLFNRITVSPEVLADEFVYCAEPERFCECADWRSVILGNVSFATRYEAFAATLAKLKEVGE